MSENYNNDKESCSSSSDLLLFPVKLTPSAETLLDVTPPPTFQNDESHDEADDDVDVDQSKPTNDDVRNERKEENSSIAPEESQQQQEQQNSSHRHSNHYSNRDAFSSPSSSSSSGAQSSASSSPDNKAVGEAAATAAASSIYIQSPLSSAGVGPVAGSLQNPLGQFQQRLPPPPQQQQPMIQPQISQQRPVPQLSPHPQFSKQSTLPQPPRQQPRPAPNSAYRRSNNFSQSEFDKAVLVAGKSGPAASSKFQHFLSTDQQQQQQQPSQQNSTTDSASSSTNSHATFLQQAEHDVLSEVMSTVEEEDEVESTDDQHSPAKVTTSPTSSQVSSVVSSRANNANDLPPPPPPPPRAESKPAPLPLQTPLPQPQQHPSYHLPPPPPAIRGHSTGSAVSLAATASSQTSSLPNMSQAQSQQQYLHNHHQQQQQQQQQDLSRDDLSSGVLPDVLMTMRQKIESLTLFDSDMMRLANAALTSTPMAHQNRRNLHHRHQVQQQDDDYMMQETRESLKRSSQQSISAAVLVGLAHKKYERRRLAAMEIEKVVRSLVGQAFQEEEEQKRQGIIPTSCSSSLDRVRAILLLLSDDYVRSTSEDARKGGVVALAACAIGLKKAPETLMNKNHNNHFNNNKGPGDLIRGYNAAVVLECRDLILASVVHACQDHSQRVRYYATESLFNVVKILPTLAVQHFFILFEILRSLYADADVDVRSGAELLDKKLKEVIVGAINSGSFTAEACVPVFARFVSMRNKATKRLTLTWLQELNEKLIGTPILEFLHLFLAGIFAMVADPNVSIRQSALAFLQSVLPKLLIVNHHNNNSGNHPSSHQMSVGGIVGSGSGTTVVVDHEDAIDNEEDRMTNKVDFDKILQSLVTSMEHPDPYVRKIAVYWMSRIVKTWFGSPTPASQPTAAAGATGTANTISIVNPDGSITTSSNSAASTTTHKPSPQLQPPPLSAAALSVRNSLPHVLPGILLSMGDTSTDGSSRDSFLPDQTTHALADQTNSCLQEAVRRDGKSYIQHLDGFIVALREELDSPGGISAARNQPAVERKPYRTDVSLDGTGIESPGWFRTNPDTSIRERENDSMMLSRLCALHWIIVLYESVVPDVLKADYAREFIGPIIRQLVDNPSDLIIFKSFEVLARITVPVIGEKGLFRVTSSTSMAGLAANVPWATTGTNGNDEAAQVSFPMNNASIGFALDILEPSRRKLMSRDREVFAALIKLHSSNHRLLVDFSRVVAFMCTLQPPEFVVVSFAVEIDRFVRQGRTSNSRASSELVKQTPATPVQSQVNSNNKLLSADFAFVSTFIQQLSHTLLNSDEAKVLRMLLRDCIGSKGQTERDNQRTRIFYILLHSFSHNLVATLSLCLWAGAYRTASLFLQSIDPLDVDLMFLLDLDKLVELIERPLLRHLHVRMLEADRDPSAEGSGTMLFRTLTLLLMIIPQSTCYGVLRDRLVSISRLRQTIARATPPSLPESALSDETKLYVSRVLEVRRLHCEARWHAIRADSLETTKTEQQRDGGKEEGTDRRNWLGYTSKDDEHNTKAKLLEEQRRWKSGISIDEVHGSYHDFESLPRATVSDFVPNQDQGDGSKNSESIPPKDDAEDAGGNNWKEYWEKQSVNE